MANPAHTGPGLTPARESDCTRLDQQKPLPQQGTAICGMFRVLTKQGPAGPLLLLQGFRVTLEGISRALVSVLQRTVVDKTHLPGNFDITLEYVDPRVQTADAPSAFTTIQEQLGLKVESRKRPVQFYVIDRVERPTAN